MSLRRPMRLRSETRARRAAARLLRSAARLGRCCGSDTEEDEEYSSCETDDEEVIEVHGGGGVERIRRVDLTLLPVRALREYLRRFRLSHKPCANKAQLLQIVTEHLHAMRVDEGCVMQAFAERVLRDRATTAPSATSPQKQHATLSSLAAAASESSCSSSVVSTSDDSGRSAR